MATHSSILDLGNSMKRGAWWARVQRVVKNSDTTERLTHIYGYFTKSDFIFYFIYLFIYWHLPDLRHCAAPLLLHIKHLHKSARKVPLVAQMVKHLPAMWETWV